MALKFVIGYNSPFYDGELYFRRTGENSWDWPNNTSYATKFLTKDEAIAGIARIIGEGVHFPNLFIRKVIEF